MTSAEKRTILEAAIDRAYTDIAETPGAEMKDGRFGDLLFNIDQMEHIAARMTEGEETQQKATGAVESQNPCPGPAADAGTAKESLAVEATEPEQTPTEAEEHETKKPAMTRDEMKAVLLEARKKGVNVPALLRQFGADSIMTLTEDKYAEVMRSIEQELANAS